MPLPQSLSCHFVYFYINKNKNQVNNVLNNVGMGDSCYYGEEKNKSEVDNY